MDYMAGGELLFRLQSCNGPFSEATARFYAAEIVSALSYLHSEAGGHVVYRDLKPENVLLDREGHVQVSDFGLAKRNVTPGCRCVSFVGSLEYVAPEVLLRQKYDKAVDWWALGTLLYEMLHGRPPFYSQNRRVMAERIVSAPLKFNHARVNPAAQLLLEGLLTRDPTQRLGSDAVHGSDYVRAAPFFNSVDWEELEARRVEPPWRPEQWRRADDASNFRPEDSGEYDADPLSCGEDQGDWRRKSSTFLGFSFADGARSFSSSNNEDYDDFDSF